MRNVFRLIVLLTAAFAPLLSQTTPKSAASTTTPQAPAGTRENPLKVSSGIMMGQSIYSPKAVFSKLPCGTNTSGATVMRALIHPEGKVEEVSVVSGPEALRQPWLDAVRQWTYKPYLVDGRAVWVQTTISAYVQFGACDPDSR